MRYRSYPVLWRWMLSLSVVWFLLPSGARADDARFTRQRPARPDGIVEVLNVSGSVRVTGWDRPTVQVTGTLGEGTREVSLTGDEYRTTVEAVLEEGVTRPGPTPMAVHVPAGSRVEVGTVHSDIRIEGVNGQVLLNTVNGDTRVSGRPEEVDVKSLKGDIHLAVVSSRVKVRSASGTATLTDVTGEADVSTVSGRVLVEGGQYSRGRFKTVSGDLAFSGGLRKGGAFDFSSHSGSITLRVPVSMPADYMVSTHEGRIVNGLTPAEREGFGPPDGRRGPGPRGRPPGPPGRELGGARPDRTRLSFSTSASGDVAPGEAPDGAPERTRVVVTSFSGDVALRPE